MIKAALRGPTGRPVILLGLTEGNVERLRNDKPIHIHADQLGFSGEIIIILGRDEDQLTEQLSPMLNPDTAIIDERIRKTQ